MSGRFLPWVALVFVGLALAGAFLFLRPLEESPAEPGKPASNGEISANPETLIPPERNGAEEPASIPVERRGGPATKPVQEPPAGSLIDVEVALPWQSSRSTAWPTGLGCVLRAEPPGQASASVIFDEHGVARFSGVESGSYRAEIGFRDTRCWIGRVVVQPGVTTVPVSAQELHAWHLGVGIARLPDSADVQLKLSIWKLGEAGYVQIGEATAGPDIDGHVTFGCLPPEAFFRLDLAGDYRLAGESRTLVFASPGVSPVPALEVAELRAVRGRVLSRDGVPLDQCPVSFMTTGGQTGTVRATASGDYLIRTTDPLAAVWTEHAKFANAAIYAPVPDNLPDLALGPGAWFEGIASKADGKPYVGVPITAVPKSPDGTSPAQSVIVLNSVTGGDGSFRLGPVDATCLVVKPLLPGLGTTELCLGQESPLTWPTPVRCDVDVQLLARANRSPITDPWQFLLVSNGVATGPFPADPDPQGVVRIAVPNCAGEDPDLIVGSGTVGTVRVQHLLEQARQGLPVTVVADARAALRLAVAADDPSTLAHTSASWFVEPSARQDGMAGLLGAWDPLVPGRRCRMVATSGQAGHSLELHVDAGEEYILRAAAPGAYPHCIEVRDARPGTVQLRTISTIIPPW